MSRICRESVLWSVFALLFFVMSSCQKEDSEVNPSATVSSDAQTVDESVGTVSVNIDLGAAATQDVTIGYEIDGTAILNGDYEVTSSSSITIAKGATSAKLNLTIFDDQVSESEKTILITFSSDVVSFTNAVAQVNITDNEPDISASGLQTDLTWDAGQLVNLDLYIAHNVVISDNYVQSFDLVQESANTKGFESIFLNNNDDDDEYYVVINYASGSRDVAFNLNFNGPGISNAEIDGTFATTDVGYPIFYGPISKSGSAYSRMASTGGQVKVGTYTGRR